MMSVSPAIHTPIFWLCTLWHTWRKEEEEEEIEYVWQLHDICFFLKISLEDSKMAARGRKQKVSFL
jgi:hypothetical protein